MWAVLHIICIVYCDNWKLNTAWRQWHNGMGVGWGITQKNKAGRQQQAGRSRPQQRPRQRPSWVRCRAAGCPAACGQLREQQTPSAVARGSGTRMSLRLPSWGQRLGAQSVGRVRGSPGKSHGQIKTRFVAMHFTDSSCPLHMPSPLQGGFCSWNII